MGSLGLRDKHYSYQDQTDLAQVDWDGNVVWKFNKKELIEDEGHEPEWMARQHHDYQREGNPVGYYAPEMECKTESGNTLILCHETIHNHKISDKQLLDDVFVEVDWEGNIVWEWRVANTSVNWASPKLRRTFSSVTLTNTSPKTANLVQDAHQLHEYPRAKQMV